MCATRSLSPGTSARSTTPAADPSGCCAKLNASVKSHDGREPPLRFTAAQSRLRSTREQKKARTTGSGPLFGQTANTKALQRHYRLTVRETVVVCVLPPPVPVMVMVRVPVVARVVVLSVRVEVPVPVIEVGLKVAVTPDGRPLADKVTAELNPPETVLVIVEVPELPPVTVIDVGEALRVKLALAGAVTVRLTVVVSTRLPLVPVTVTVYVPVAVVEATVKVRVEVPVPVMEVGLKPTVTPVGWPLAVKATAELNPPVTVLVIVVPPLLPWVTETEVGEAETLKPGVAGPVSALIRAAPFGLPQPVAKS